MAISVRYPRVITLENGAPVRTTVDDQKDRNLAVEINASEEEVRGAFAREGFTKPLMEFHKPGQLGDGMAKRYDDWQVHVRFFRHAGNIQIDGEVEVSSAYFQHLTHGWIPYLLECMDLIERHFGTAYVYHKKYQMYVTQMSPGRRLSLPDPESKTSVVTTALTALVIVGFVTLAALYVLGGRRG